MDISISEAIQAALAEEVAAIAEVSAVVCHEVAREATAMIRKTAPRLTGLYAKDWTYMSKGGRLSSYSVVYGKKRAGRISHLLENGHAKRGGGRVPGIPHLKQVEEWAAQEAVKRISDAVKG